MSRPSSVDKLPQELLDEISSLRGAGHTIDEILASLRELHGTEISRSALGRHIKTMEEVGRDLRQSNEIAQMLVRQMGDEPASRVTQANIQLMHSVIMKLMIGDKEALADIVKDPESIMLLTKSLDHLTRASKSDAEFVAKIEARVEARMRKSMEKNLNAAVKKKGLTAETAQTIMQGLIKS